MTDVLVEVCEDAAAWRHALHDIGPHDFVHTYDFHRLSSANGEGEPIIFIARDAVGKAVALWPALVRKIEGSERHDLTSVYGYGGPLFAPDVVTTPVIRSIFDAMSKSGAVSLFSRMHPLFVDRIGDIELRGERLSDVVIVPISSTDRPPAGYRGSHRREIIKGLEAGIEISDELDEEAVRQFKSVYDATMTVLGARDYYIFSADYYAGLIGATDFSVELLRARYEGQCISAAIFVRTGDIVQYYLSGTLPEYRKLAPSKVLIADAHRRAAARGSHSLILGGGVGSAHDALFRFKAGFSGNALPFHVTRKILDKQAYDALCASRAIDPNGTSYFPAYRS